MLKIGTSPTGRQVLLNNLYIRNYLYGKYLTIEVVIDDKLDKDGNVDMSAPLVVDFSYGENSKSQHILGSDILNKIKDTIEEQNKYNVDFKL